MRAALASFFLCAGLLCAGGPALASPDGAPWDHDSGPGRPDCTACHFDNDAVQGSDLLALGGLKDVVSPDATVELTITFAGDAEAAGFLMTASGGAFAAGEGIESRGGSVRSTAPRAPDKDGAVRWRVRWTAPAEISGEKTSEIAFYIALNAANMDASPFGDTVYLSTVTARLGEQAARDR